MAARSRPWAKSRAKRCAGSLPRSWPSNAKGPSISSSAGCSAIGIVRQSGEGRVTVELEPPARCPGCAGACLWYRVPPREQLVLAADSKIPVGAAVTVTLPDRYVLVGAVVVYGLPLGGLLAGAVAAGAFLGTDLAAAAGAAAGAVAALLIASPLRRRLERATLQQLAVRRVA